MQILLPYQGFISFSFFMNDLIVFICFYLAANNYALLFPRKGTSDYVIITHSMPSLKAVTVCLWMKSSDKGNAGTPLSYNMPGANINELLLFDYRNFHFYVRESNRYKC